MNFNKQFNSFYPILVAISRRYAAGTDIPFEEYESSLSEEFFLKYEGFDPNKSDNFNAYMRVVLTQRASRVANRSERKFYDNMVFFESEQENEEGEVQEFDIPLEWDLEEHVIKKLESKTDDDKRELINALVKETDSITKKIVTEYLRNEDAKPTGIGKALGIHHQTVIRKLSYLSRNFDEREFGEIDAYLAV